MKNRTEPIGQLLPPAKYDWPLVFQDRNFNQDGSFCFPIAKPTAGRPTGSPFWIPACKTFIDFEQRLTL